jgi:hypothetical protein
MYYFLQNCCPPLSRFVPRIGESQKIDGNSGMVKLLALIAFLICNIENKITGGELAISAGVFAFGVLLKYLYKTYLKNWEEISF